MGSKRIPMAAGAVAMLVAAIAAVLLLVDLGESAGSEVGITLRQVAEHPQRFAGQTVTVSGEYAENDYFSTSDARLAFVVGDDAGVRVLVLPQPDATVPERITENTTLRVTGEVRVVDPQEASGGRLDLGGVLSRTHPSAVIEAHEVDIPYTRERRPPRAQTATIEQLLADPAAWDEVRIHVPGTIARVVGSGFVLADKARALFVDAPFTDLDKLDRGQRIMVIGELERLSEFRADQARAALRKTGDGAADVDVGPGDPFLVLRALRSPAVADDA